jgi:hypothetical protein
MFTALPLMQVEMQTFRFEPYRYELYAKDVDSRQKEVANISLWDTAGGIAGAAS